MSQLLAPWFLFASCSIFSQDSKTDHAQTVKDFIAAFNAHDGDAMSEFVSDDIQWLSVDGSSISIEADGKAALVSAMDSYFRSCPSCRSRLAEVIVSRDRVSAIEVASWQDMDEPRTQRSLSVYEFSDGLIKRVYYFPVER